MPGSRGLVNVVSIASGIARWRRRRSRPPSPSRILVLHRLLLGDTLMVTSLLAKLRALYPGAEITMTVAPEFLPLYTMSPYHIDAVPFDGRDMDGLRRLFRQRRYDLAILPADNRWSWLARGLGVRWIVGFAGDRPGRKNWPVDELRPYAARPEAFSDTVASLVDGPPPPRFASSQWRGPRAPALPIRRKAYAVLHVGASTPLTLWPAPRWRALASQIHARGLDVVWSAGPGEEKLIEEIHPPANAFTFPGNLKLDALWHLLADAKLLVCPDTGVAHLGRVIGVPTVALFGPGSARVNGAGDFWADQPYRAVTVDPFPCRDQSIQFFREVSWLRRCERAFGDPPDRCPRARCMEAIAVDTVAATVNALLA